MSEAAGRQLLLDFPRIDPSQRPVIETSPYRSALIALRKWKSWPEGQLALCGEAFAGRTRLARLWAADAGAAIVTARALSTVDMGEISRLSISALAIDDADVGAVDTGTDGRAILSALNLCRDRGAPVLLTGKGEPGAWFSTPPDLASRLRAMPVTTIGEPDDETLALRLREEGARRHLNLSDESVDYLAPRMERSWAAVELVVDQIERTRGRAETKASARAVLKALGMDAG